MSPIQVTPTPAHTSGPDPWRIVAIILITSFILSLLASGAVISYLNRKKTRLEAIANGLHRMRAPNPHPFGSDAWREHELSGIPSSALDALRVADLEAQNSLLEQRAEALEGLVHLCEEGNKRLHRENAELRLGSDPVLDEEVMRRVLQELHGPIQRPESDSRGFERQEVTGMDGASEVGFVAPPDGTTSADESNNPGVDLRKDPGGLRLPLVPSIFTDRRGSGEFIGSLEEIDLIARHVPTFCNRRQSGSSERGFVDIELCEYRVSGRHSP